MAITEAISRLPGSAIRTYLTDWQFLPHQAIVRVDGQYGDGVVIADILATGIENRRSLPHLQLGSTIPRFVSSSRVRQSPR
jgi:hypothetical protein